MKNTNPFNSGRKLPAGGVQTWLGKVTAFGRLLGLRNSQEGPGGAVRSPAGTGEGQPASGLASLL